jgi:hypothetical protein
MMRYCWGVVLCVAGLSAWADIAITAEARDELFVTVYRDFGVIRDVRKGDLPKGNTVVRFEGVAPRIDPSSVMFEFPDSVTLHVREQKYEFDLVSPEKLMEKYIGKELEIVPKKGMWPDTGIQEAELISIHGREPVFRIGTKITFGDIGQILFPYVPDNLYTRPTLLWTIDSPNRQRVTFEVTYLTEGIRWEADYVLMVNEGEGGESILTGWITIDNMSGTDYDQAVFAVVAGDVQRRSPELYMEFSSKHDVMATGSSGRGERELPRRQQFNEYYLYLLPYSLSLQNNQKKQIEWIPRRPVTISKKYLFESSTYGGIRRGEKVLERADVVYCLDEKAMKKLGMPLPQGTIRIFDRDESGIRRFSGEGSVADIPVGHPLEVVSGKAFDITMTRRVLEFERKSEKLTVSTRRLTVRNTKESGADVSVRENLGVNWKITKSSESYKKYDAFTVEWNVKIPQGITKEITYTVENKL